MPRRGLEPLRIAPPDPKSSVYVSEISFCLGIFVLYVPTNVHLYTFYSRTIPDPDMPRSASLTARFSKSRELAGKAAWYVLIPPHLSSSGREQRLFFPTKKAATLECEKLKARKDNFGISLTAMSPARIAEAAEAYNLLEPYGLGLLDAVREGLKVVRRGKPASLSLNCSISLSMPKPIVPSNTERSSAGHATASRSYTSASPPRSPPLELERILKPLSPGARNPVMRYLRAVFNYGLKRGLLSRKPHFQAGFHREATARS